MYEPILMSKKSFDALTSKQQKALMKAGKVAEKYMTKEAAGFGHYNGESLQKSWC